MMASHGLASHETRNALRLQANQASEPTIENHRRDRALRGRPALVATRAWPPRASRIGHPTPLDIFRPAAKMACPEEGGGGPPRGPAPAHRSGFWHLASTGLVNGTRERGAGQAVGQGRGLGLGRQNKIGSKQAGLRAGGAP